HRLLAHHDIRIIKIVPWEVLPKGEKIWNVFKNGKSYSNVSESEKQKSARCPNTLADMVLLFL
ncbi:hypothetical protein, partial [Lactobacillus helveticus]|uniref:hypothetical protein n=1 Tax=Lactobacillus helveticus TaxID=1587 RepID=UPI001C265F6A